MQTLADFLAWAEEYFVANGLNFGHGTDNAWDEAIALARYVLELSPTATMEVFTRSLCTEEKNQLLNLAKKRVIERMPVAYLTKEAWFCDDKYYVDQRVIIPRSPFAELIKNKFQPWLKSKIYDILDLCTGSGCIAIACANIFPKIKVDAVDISQDALAVADHNIKLHKVADRVLPLQSDLFNNLPSKQYDIIISNPPYVSEREHHCLPAEYQHEPKLALISGIDGLNCTREILKNAHKFLQGKGLLFVEVGNCWQTLAKLYPTIPFQWLTFVNGGEGVFMLTKKQLLNIPEGLFN